MKYYVYFLKSSVNNHIYIGSTANIDNRLKLHNSGKVKFTKAYKPWKLLDNKEYESRGEAIRQELFFKTGQQKEILKERFKDR